MKRRDFLFGMGSAALVMPNLINPMTNEAETPESIYARSLAIDAQSFAAAPPKEYVTYLTEDKIEALRTSGRRSTNGAVRPEPSKRSSAATMPVYSKKWWDESERYPTMTIIKRM